MIAFEQGEFGAWHKTEITTLPNGHVEIRHSTNDDNDDGLPDGKVTSWSDVFPPHRAAGEIARCGKSRVGISGIRVTVILDGEQI